MVSFYSQEIESQDNLIKMLPTDSKNYKKDLKVIKKDIAYLQIKLKEKLEDENIVF